MGLTERATDRRIEKALVRLLHEADRRAAGGEAGTLVRNAVVFSGELLREMVDPQRFPVFGRVARGMSQGEATRQVCLLTATYCLQSEEILRAGLGRSGVDDGRVMASKAVIEVAASLLPRGDEIQTLVDNFAADPNGYYSVLYQVMAGQPHTGEAKSLQLCSLDLVMGLIKETP